MLETNPVTDTIVFIGMVLIAAATATLLALGVI
jgi:hypothetical protein